MHAATLLFICQNGRVTKTLSKPTVQMMMGDTLNDNQDEGHDRKDNLKPLRPALFASNPANSSLGRCSRSE
jgi:hypothetical protein